MEFDGHSDAGDAEGCFVVDDGSVVARKLLEGLPSVLVPLFQCAAVL